MRLFDKFERMFLFRITRGIYLVLASVVTISLICTLAFLFFAAFPAFKGIAPPKPQPPEIPQVTATEIGQMIEAEKNTGQIPPATIEPPEEQEYSDEMIDPDYQKINDLMERIHTAYFPGEGYPWYSIVETFCRDRDWWGRCYRTGSRTAKEGMQSRLISAMEDFDDTQKIAFLERVLGIMPLVPTAETSRILTVKALVDTCRAYKRLPTDVFDEIVVILQGGRPDPKKPEIKLTPPDDANKDLLFAFILEITKRDSTPDHLIVIFKNWERLPVLFEQDKCVAAMSVIWQAIKSLEIEQVQPTIEDIILVLKQIPNADRPRAIELYESLLSNRIRQSQNQYRAALSEHEASLIAIEADHELAQLKKKTYRKYGLYGVGASLAGIALISILLSMLAVERNSRLIESLNIQNKPGGQPESKS